MHPQPFATEVHYDWLKQGRADAQLSDAEPLLLEPLDLVSMSPADLLASLTKYGVAVVRGHGIESAKMFQQAKSFFAMVPASKQVPLHVPLLYHSLTDPLGSNWPRNLTQVLRFSSRRSMRSLTLLLHRWPALWTMMMMMLFKASLLI